MNNSLENNTLTLILEEDLLSTTVKPLLSEAQEVIEDAGDVETVVVDLSEVKTIDSQGLNLIVGIYQECRSRDWKFAITGASQAVKRLFQFVKLSERFGIQAG